MSPRSHLNKANRKMSIIKKQIKKALPAPVVDGIITVRTHMRGHGYFPNLIRPQSFNDKVLHRMLFDRRGVLTQMADKAAVRSYVEARLGPKILPELYYLTTLPETIPFSELPDKFVVKPTHGSGWVQIVSDKSSLDPAALRACLRSLYLNSCGHQG